ncbi:MFS transporter [Leucobacter sp. OLJS4]|uniref:MFS transporter n=1 Tax=unclassified Leucobacter TaxID=2621730 RepID=UPI000C19CEF4|nr:MULTISPECIES: MFS transporter [unclassified Leucobacter]PII82215.1 MFS transporter [Leucobacter sp. OLCALW19]PII88501.1 MFS transporter [Leucobacter sp. OLTLW20]PII94193.1 MFS transporter [Leucobacter sp. OLAS13]PII98235.1 MFS transporter [Leucobacter sp. OLDS2]PIJ03496.1 MFS transporter [Leucobacter sp. OLIS6]
MPEHTSGTQHAPTGRRLEVDDVIVVEPAKMKLALRGAFVGNFMEWYDFGIYGYLAVTMTKVFTAGMPDSLGLTVTLLGFAVSFLVRPFGGMILGPIGDRIGRQKVLYFTMAIMAVSTAVIGMLPSAAQAGGFWIIIPLYLLKMTQGFSTGGEFAGATTYVSEFSPDKDRGYWASKLNVGSYLGFAAGATVVALTTLTTENLLGIEDAMVEWGWRIPFLLAIPLGAIAIYFRMRIPEPPGFEETKELQHEQPPTDPHDLQYRHGLGSLIRVYWKQILIGISIVAAEGTAGYALTSYMPTYLEKDLGISNLNAAIATVPVLVIMSLLLPTIGRWSDRVGRRRVYFLATGSSLVLMLPAFLILQTAPQAGMWVVFLALGIVAIPVAFFVSMTASALPALFPTAARFSGMGITYNLAASLFAGTTPLIADLLVNATAGSWISPFMPALWIMTFSAIAVLAVLAMRETGARPLLGSVPTVATRAEAQELVATQDENPFIDTSTMPLRVVPARRRPAGRG